MEDLVALASKDQGWVFGSFVRDVVVPSLNRREITVRPTIINLFFKNWSPYGSFMNRCSMEGYTFALEGHVKLNSGYTTTMFYVTKEDIAFMVYIIVYKAFPVDDFDVNQITYQRLNGKWVNDMSFSDFIARCDKKEATMLQAVVEKEFEQIKPDFFDKGWKVYFRDRAQNKYELYPETTYDVFCKIVINDKPMNNTTQSKFTEIGDDEVLKVVPHLYYCTSSPPSIYGTNAARRIRIFRDINELGSFNEWEKMVEQRDQNVATIEGLTLKVRQENEIIDAYVKKHCSTSAQDKEIAMTQRIKQLESELAAQKAIVTRLKTILE